MDTSVERMTDRLGRPTGPRRKYTVAEKLSILAETRRRGASVAEVARSHGINANLLFGWRRLERRGALRAEPVDSPPLLPVRSLDGCFEVRPEARLLSLVPSSRLKRFERRRLEEAYTSKRLIPLAPKNFTETSSVSIC